MNLFDFNPNQISFSRKRKSFYEGKFFVPNDDVSKFIEGVYGDQSNVHILFYYILHRRSHPAKFMRECKSFMTYSLSFEKAKR